DPRPRPRIHHRAAPASPPRCQPPGAGPRERPRRHHLPHPLLHRGFRGQPRRRDHPRQPQRRLGRGLRSAAETRRWTPIPPRTGRGTLRCPPFARLVPQGCLMPRRTDLTSVLVIGSGPIVIGQAAEFDYSGTQACRVLKEEGLRVILVNSNPATIMTDPALADATYVEPSTPEVGESIIAKDRPAALLATLGGQTALNTAVALHEGGVLAKYDVELIGVRVEAIHAGEDRHAFKGVVERCGAEGARSRIAHSMADCLAAAEDLGYPLVVRPSFTMGGLGSGIAFDEAELRSIAGAGLHYSPTTEVLLEESILGWKEYELELVRDNADTVVVVC